MIAGLLLRRRFHLERILFLPRGERRREVEINSKHEEGSGQYEVQHPVPFGLIRLDSENAAKIHRNPEEESYVQNVPNYPRKESIMEKSADLFYFENGPPKIYDESGQSEVESRLSKGIDEDKSSENPSLTSSGMRDSGFIDNQYFSTLPESTPENEPFIDCREEVDRTKQLVEESTQDLNSIDEQLFPSDKNVKHKKERPKKPNLRPGSALEYVKKHMKPCSEPEKTRSNKSKELLVSEIGVSLQKRLMAVHDEIYDKPSVLIKKDSLDVPNSGVSLGKLNDKYKAPEIYNMTSMEVEKLLQKSVIYNNHGIVAINKPFGLPIFDNNGAHSVTKYLKPLADYLGVSDSLHQVHRLDKSTTGTLIFATSPDHHALLVRLFRQRKITKIYWAITNGVPSPTEGIIDIPIGEEKINERFRMMLRPVEKSPLYSRKRKFTNIPAHPAVTEFKVLKSLGNAAFVEVNAQTGFKHQVRIHLGFGLSTPILGDHKYSDVRGEGKPQRVKGDILARIRTRASKSRDLPMFLHAREIIIPEIAGQQNIQIVSGIPPHFSKMKRRLKI